jgi:hypothetical protein
VGHLPPSQLELEELAFVSVDAGATLEANTLVVGDANDGAIDVLWRQHAFGGAQLLVGAARTWEGHNRGRDGRVQRDRHRPTGFRHDRSAGYQLLLVGDETVVGGDGELRNGLTSTLDH